MKPLTSNRLYGLLQEHSVLDDCGCDYNVFVISDEQLAEAACDINSLLDESYRGLEKDYDYLRNECNRHQNRIGKLVDILREHGIEVPE